MAASMEVFAERSFDTFLMWSVDALKNFLRKYGISVSSSKRDLAEKAFAAWEMRLEPVQSDPEIRVSS
jgi:hypothetical protein